MSVNLYPTNCLGYPRIGENRELKRATEAYWSGKLTLEQLQETGRNLRRQNWFKQKKSGIDLIPSNDFSFYDQVLDTSALVGNIPERFGWQGETVDPDTLFAVARGRCREAGTHEDCDCGHSATAAEMTKWLDTNYHYIVPELGPDTTFRLASNKPIDEFLEARALGILTKPVLVGPVTYLTLGKVSDSVKGPFDRFALLDRLLAVYQEMLRRLQDAGAEWVQIDEPILSLDLLPVQKHGLRRSCAALAAAAPKLKILLTTYFEELRNNLDLACALDCDALHIDAVRGRTEAERVAASLPPGRSLSLGLVDARNIWKNDYEESLGLIRAVEDRLGMGRLILATSCSLLHSPVTLESETQLDEEVKNWLAFADQKLGELQDLADLAEGRPTDALEANRQAIQSRRASPRIHRPKVRERLAGIDRADARRASPFPRRRQLQRERFRLPPFPTTTIGSFPQTNEIRTARARWKRGELSDTGYRAFLEDQTKSCIAFQEEIGLDMLVHGEFERNDMVEYFGEQLEGFVFTKKGWVQSYGSRYVKPPIIFGDVSRPRPMTVDWAVFAQKCTEKPMKGMLTGPVTILQWSFVRDDQPRDATARQIALAIRDEAVDLEKAGIAAIQIDEAAFREGLPLRRSDWQTYLGWAVESFRLTSSGVRDETQIHTHMCYSNFNDIIETIAAMDADVITIETSRSNMELLNAFVNFKYPADIGPGVYDIHSPRVPETREMVALMEKARQVIPSEHLWVNPDCGLKTRKWEEVDPSLRRLVECARSLRNNNDNH